MGALQADDQVLPTQAHAGACGLDAQGESVHLPDQHVRGQAQGLLLELAAGILEGEDMRRARDPECWRVMHPLLDAPPPVHAYQPGSWGPDAADELAAPYGGWREPWVRP